MKSGKVLPVQIYNIGWLYPYDFIVLSPWNRASNPYTQNQIGGRVKLLGVNMANKVGVKADFALVKTRNKAKYGFYAHFRCSRYGLEITTIWNCNSIELLSRLVNLLTKRLFTTADETSAHETSFFQLITKGPLTK